MNRGSVFSICNGGEISGVLSGTLHDGSPGTGTGSEYVKLLLRAVVLVVLVVLMLLPLLLLLLPLFLPLPRLLLLLLPLTSCRLARRYADSMDCARLITARPGERVLLKFRCAACCCCCCCFWLWRWRCCCCRCWRVC